MRTSNLNRVPTGLYARIRHKIPVEEPQQISPQAGLFDGAPKPEDFALARKPEVISEKPKAADEGGLSESGSQSLSGPDGI